MLAMVLTESASTPAKGPKPTQIAKIVARISGSIARVMLKKVRVSV